MTSMLLAKALLYLTLGGVLGAAYFSALDWNVRLYAEAGAGWKALQLHLGRLLGAVAVFAILARMGALPLLAAFAGFLAARTIAVSRHRVRLEAQS